MDGLPWANSTSLQDGHDSDDEFYRIFVLPSATANAKIKRGGSSRGKRADVDRGRAEWGARLISDYFGDNPTYDEREFRRRFRMRRCLFETIVAALVDDEQSNYFAQRPDATGLLGFLPEQKVTCALRMLAYGASADQLDEVIRMGESTALETLKTFCSSVVRIFGPEYLRKPTQSDVEALLEENAARGFPGMIGSLDCMHWTWKNCPTAWAGVYKGKEKASTIILEAVASRSLWIWHAFYGVPGSNNDLNVLERSPLLDDLVNGDGLQVSFKVNGTTYNHAYYLTDGIYPAWAIFQRSISDPENKKQKLFAAMQEAVRKDVERAFGVLQQRFRIIALPCKLWSPSAMSDVMLTCIILHNLIIENELGYCASDEYLYEDKWVSPSPPVSSESCPVTNIAQALKTTEDDVQHYELRRDLVEHIWREFGDNRLCGSDVYLA